MHLTHWLKSHYTQVESLLMVFFNHFSLTTSDFLCTASVGANDNIPLNEGVKGKKRGEKWPGWETSVCLFAWPSITDQRLRSCPVVTPLNVAFKCPGPSSHESTRHRMSANQPLQPSNVIRAGQALRTEPSSSSKWGPVHFRPSRRSQSTGVFHWSLKLALRRSSLALLCFQFCWVFSSAT